MHRIDLPDSDIHYSLPADIRELVQRFQRICLGSGYGFWEWHRPDNRLALSGQYWCELGYDASFADAPDASRQLSAFVHPDDRPLLARAVRDHLRGGSTIDLSCRILARDGSYVWTRLRASVRRDSGGKVLYLCGINFDISLLKQVEDELRESEARQARIIEASSDGIWEWYAHTGGMHFSARCWQLLGYEEHDDLATSGEDRLQVWRQHIYPPDLEKFEEALRSHRVGKSAFDVEYRINSKQGELRWIRARGRIHFDGQGRPLRMAGTNMDITEMKRAEERVLKAKEAAEKANRAKSEFLSSMSHELRTPLNAILGYARLFEFDDNLTGMQQDNVLEIRRAGEHLLQLINEVLDLSRIESGNMTVTLEPVLAARAITECFTLLQHQADARGIRLYTSLNALDHVYVVADSTRLKQALINLISNAIKYNRLGGEVEVSLSRAGDNRMIIAIRDTGDGIPLARQGEVFQPFARLHAEASKVEGSGVGLVITRRLIEMMRGSISFTSEENVGSVFKVSLPLSPEWSQPARDSRRESVPPAAPADLRQPPVLLWQTRGRVLYIEDNISNIRLLQHTLSRYPLIELDVAEEAFLGIFKARTRTPDIIIMDINLPGMDGYEALSVLRRDAVTRHIPVIGLSANAMAYDVEKGLNAGFYDYLTKPVDLVRLIGALNELQPGAAGLSER